MCTRPKVVVCGSADTMVLVAKGSYALPIALSPFKRHDRPLEKKEEAPTPKTFEEKNKKQLDKLHLYTPPGARHNKRGTGKELVEDYINGGYIPAEVEYIIYESDGGRSKYHRYYLPTGMSESKKEDYMKQLKGKSLKSELVLQDPETGDFLPNIPKTLHDYAKIVYSRNH